MGGFPPDQFLADVAKEINLSETAYVVPRAASGAGSGGGGDGGGAPMEFDLRWFTPSGTEVDLCGRTWRIWLSLATSQDAVYRMC
jgi:predicted PhzF superfamily epimerase YddE/YHI9